MRDKLQVEVRGKGDEDKHDGDEEAGGDPGDRLTDGVELDPAQDGDLDEEHEDPKYSGEAPGELHYEVHLHMRRLENGLLSLKRDVESISYKLMLQLAAI